MFVWKPKDELLHPVNFIYDPLQEYEDSEETEKQTIDENQLDMDFKDIPINRKVSDDIENL